MTIHKVTRAMHFFTFHSDNYEIGLEINILSDWSKVLCLLSDCREPEDIEHWSDRPEIPSSLSLSYFTWLPKNQLLVWEKEIEKPIASDFNVLSVFD